MGISQIRILKMAQGCCSTDNDQQALNQTTTHLNEKFKIIRNDYKKFENQTWFRFQRNLFFDPKKFIFLYSNYDEEQTKLVRHWKNIDMKNAEFGRIGDPDNVKSERWKYAIRRGVPIIYYKSLISVIFNRNYEFLNVKGSYEKLVLEYKIEQVKSKQSPSMFGLHASTLKQAVFAPFLNNSGYSALSNILFLLQKTKGGRLIYNPYLAHLIALFLIFFQEEQAYDLVSIMVDGSRSTNNKKMQSLRWHCVFKEEQLQAIGQSFYTIISSKSGTIRKLTKSFQSLKIDKIKIFKSVIQNFFYGILPFKIILKVFLLFLNEGIKMIFRLFYSLLKKCQLMLLECQTTDKCIAVIRKRWVACEDHEYDDLLKLAYNIVLQKYISMKIEESFYTNKEQIVYYIPFIKNQSEVLTFDDLQVIWAFLPTQLRHYDLEKVFPTRNYSDNSAQSALDKYNDIISILQQNQLTLLVVKTHNDDVFGVFFAKGLMMNKQGYAGHSQNFLFQLRPNKRKYVSTGQNMSYLIHKQDCLQIGGGGIGPSLRLKKSFEFGQSFSSNTYKNQPLHGNKSNPEFKIKQIEVFKMY